MIIDAPALLTLLYQEVELKACAPAQSFAFGARAETAAVDALLVAVPQLDRELAQ